MDRLGLSPAALIEVNPALIVLTVSGQGNTGPDAAQTSYGSTLEAAGGFAWSTGYDGGPPVVTGKELNYPDQAVAMFAAGMVIAAWLKRRRDGLGAVLDVSQRELTSFLIGERFAAHGAPRSREGNADPFHAVQDCFRSADGGWVAVSLSPAGIPVLARILGIDEGAPAGELREATAAWMAAGPAADRAGKLQVQGIAAAPVLDGLAVREGEGRLWHSALLPAPDGTVLKGMPFDLAAAPARFERDAPSIGESTACVLEDVAGYTPGEVAALLARGVIELLPQPLEAAEA
jgi:formyl-CoA transferase